MRSFLQLTLDLFHEALAPSSALLKIPSNDALAGIESAQSATELVAATHSLQETAAHNGQRSTPEQSLSSVLRPTHFSHPRANREARLQALAGRRIGQGGDECIVAYEFRRGKRKTIGFVIGADGLVVSAPRWVPLYEVDKALQEKSAWILNKLAEAQERLQKQVQAQVQWKEGAVIPFLGENVIIVIDPRQADGAGKHAAASAQGTSQLHTDAQALPGVPRLTLHIGLPHDASPERIRDAVQAWLMRQAKRLFEERLNHFAPLLGVRWTKLSLSNASSRWGSAGSDGAIRLNWRLIHFRQTVIDYVVVHELSHLRVMDHSPRFWSTVESIMPDYAQRKGMLKDEAIPKW
jgi:predicted metal-dependent hydrolase